MRHNLKQELKASMDSLRFSPQAKEDMTQMLMKESNKQKNASRPGGRKLMLLALAAVLLVATLTGAAVFTRWSRSAENRYHPSQEVKEQAEKSGLSVMLEDTAEEAQPDEILSVTDQGITVTAVQSIIDEYQAEIVFRVEGFDLPEGEDPFAWPVVTLDGKQEFFTSMTGSFYDGTTRNEEGKRVYAATGLPVESDETGTVILDYVAQDGSMEYTLNIQFRDDEAFRKEFGSPKGKEICVTFQSFDIQGGRKAGPSIPWQEGNWELRWKLTSSAESITVTPNEEIGESGVILLDAEIGQKTIRTNYQLPEYWAGWETLESLPERLQGVRMKDGTEYLCIPTSEGYRDQEKLLYFMEFTLYDGILDPAQVESLMFYKGWETDSNGEPTAQTYWYMPIG